VLHCPADTAPPQTCTITPGPLGLADLDIGLCRSRLKKNSLWPVATTIVYKKAAECVLGEYHDIVQLLKLSVK